ncbi:MAG: hypothetical protein HQK50_13940 [Oligoflexia bacterium]|nr:hypothetical protein [Oligoflexia bacterium]
MLDVKTIFFNNIIVSFCLIAVMLAYNLSNKTYPGHNKWIGSVVCMMLAYVGFLLRSTHPLLGVVICQFFFTATYLLHLDGYCEFFQNRRIIHKGYYLIPVMAVISVVIIYSKFADATLIVKSMAFWISLILVNTVLLLRKISIEKKGVLLQLSLGLNLLNLLMFAFSCTPWVQLEYAIFVQNLINVMVTILYILLHNQRAEEELALSKNNLLLSNQRLSTTLGELKVLHGSIPICECCKSVQDESGSWMVFERYIKNKTEAAFTHGICPECKNKILAAGEK